MVIVGVCCGGREGSWSLLHLPPSSSFSFAISVAVAVTVAVAFAPASADVAAAVAAAAAAVHILLPLFLVQPLLIQCVLVHRHKAL